MKGKFDWKETLAAFSLAVLWFTNVWREFVFSSSYNFYFDYSPALEYTAMILNVALLTLVFLVLVKLAKRASNVWLKRLFQISFLALGLSSFCGLGSEIMKAVSPETTFFVTPLLPLAVLAVCAGAAAVFRRKFSLSAIVANLKTISLLLAPFALLTCLQLFWIWFNTVSVMSRAPAAAAEKNEKDVSENREQPPPPSTKKVVWVVFDGLDYEAMVVKRDPNTELPEIDRLMNESFVAENAFSPAFLTQEAMPALLTGRRIKKAVPSAPNDLTLYPEDNPSEPLSLRDDGGNLIARISSGGGGTRGGVKTGIVGWTHPYPRIFDRQIAAGYWHSLQHAQCYDLLDCSGYLYRMSLQTVPGMTRLFPSLWFNEKTNQVERHKYLRAKALELAARSDFKFLFFHFSIPHGPFIDRHDHLTESYSDALEAVDETVRQIRETLERTGQWDDTILIVTSDHFGRGKVESVPPAQRAGKEEVIIDTRIPFIVKFPAAKNRFDYKPPFNTVVTKHLILSIFEEDVRNSEDLARRLDRLAITEPESINFKPDVKSLFDVLPYKRDR